MVAPLEWHEFQKDETGCKPRWFWQNSYPSNLAIKLKEIDSVLSKHFKTQKKDQKIKMIVKRMSQYILS
jgi:hypothetical protein